MTNLFKAEKYGWGPNNADSDVSRNTMEFQEWDRETNIDISHKCVTELKCMICDKPLCHINPNYKSSEWIEAVCFSCNNHYTPWKKVNK